MAFDFYDDFPYTFGAVSSNGWTNLSGNGDPIIFHSTVRSINGNITYNFYNSTAYFTGGLFGLIRARIICGADNNSSYIQMKGHWNGGTFYSVDLSDSDNTLKITRSGTTLTTMSFSRPTDASTHNLDMTFTSGNTITVYWDGVQQLQTTDSNLWSSTDNAWGFVGLNPDSEWTGIYLDAAGIERYASFDLKTSSIITAFF